MRGFAALPELGNGHSSNGRENKVSVVDLKTLKLITKIETGENPDWIVYERSQKKIYTMNSRGKSASVIDTATNKVGWSMPRPASGTSTWRISTRSSSTRRPAVLEVVQTIKTVRGARTMTLDPATRIIYLAATVDEPQAPGSTDRPKAAPAASAS